MYFGTFEHVVIFPPCGFKSPAHRPLRLLLCSSPEDFAFTMAGCFGSFPSPRALLWLIAPHHERSSSGLVYWLRATLDPGWQWGRSSGSCLSGHASYQLSQSHVGESCQSWCCDDASPQHYPSLPGACDAAVAVAYLARKFPGHPQSGWRGCKSNVQLLFERRLLFQREQVFEHSVISIRSSK